MYYTDYPFEELNDIPFKPAPVREITILSYDGDKYCKILVEGIISEIKSGYIYKEAKRYSDNSTFITQEVLNEYLIKNE